MLKYISKSNVIFFILAAAFTFIGIIFALNKQENGFLSGGCDQSNSSYLSSIDKAHKISYCQGGDSDIVKIVSEPFIPRGEIKFWYAGYPSMTGLGVSIISASGDLFKIELPNAGDKWMPYSTTIPLNFQDSEVRLVAIDDSSDTFGWLGISSLTNSSSAMLYSVTIGLLKIFAIGFLFHFALAVLLSFFLRYYIIDIAVPLLLVYLGLTGYASFFLYFWNTSVGIGFSILYLLVIISICINMISSQKTYLLVNSFKLLMPVFLLMVFIVFVGYFPFDKVGPDNWLTAANRWLPLPIDNWIPKIFADQIWSGKIQRPMVGDWLSSDRGPLQTGIILIFFPLFPNDGLLYQTVATMLQVLVILPVWLVLRKFLINLTAELLFTLGFSSLVLLNSLFVWPKLISASYVLLVYLFAHADRKQISHFQHIFLIGASSALALLSHGGAIFPLLTLGLFYLFDTIQSSDRSRIFNSGVMSLFVFLLIIAPWLVYSTIIDPSDSRLLKWHFAGHIPPTEIPFRDLLIISYQNISYTEWVEAKFQNLIVIFSGNLIADIFMGGADVIKIVFMVSIIQFGFFHFILLFQFGR